MFNDVLAYFTVQLPVLRALTCAMVHWDMHSGLGSSAMHPLNCMRR